MQPLATTPILLADVRGALGPYLNVFLVTQQHWSQSEVGLVTMISGLLGLAVQTPIGAAIDETRAKRGAIVLALAVLGIGAVIIFAWPSFWPVLFAESQMTFTEYTLDNTPINARPDCPQCAAQMYLARIEPEKPGHDLRTFECPRCQHVERAVVQFK